jgi:hypothetical protein
VANINYVYPIAFFDKMKGPVGAMIKGWQLSGILTFYTGSPFTVTTSNVDPAGLGLLGNSAASSRPDLVCNPYQGAAGTVAAWFNTACFKPVPDGQVRPGNAGRGVLRGPGFENWDATLSKTFSLKERYNFQFRAETFNLLNHPNPNAFGSTNITSTLFGTISSFRAARRLQLAIKFTF